MKVRKTQTVITLTKEERGTLDNAAKIIYSICNASENGNCSTCPFSELCEPASMRIAAFENEFEVKIEVEDE